MDVVRLSPQLTNDASSWTCLLERSREEVFVLLSVSILQGLGSASSSSVQLIRNDKQPRSMKTTPKRCSTHVANVIIIQREYAAYKSFSVISEIYIYIYAGKEGRQINSAPYSVPCFLFFAVMLACWLTSDKFVWLSNFIPPRLLLPQTSRLIRPCTSRNE
jgi:hypothetical protein